MLKFKLVPFGKKHQIHYRLCVAEENSKLTSDVVEVVGHYHPLENHKFVADNQRIKFWLSQGARPTDRVKKLLSKNK